MYVIGQQKGEVKQYDKARYLLENGAAVLVFRKKNDELRVMMCTRNFRVANMFGYDAHLNSRNTAKSEADGNLIVTDLIIGETRQVNISRIMYSCWLTQPEDETAMQQLVNTFTVVKNAWEGFDDLDPIHQSVFLRDYSLYNNANS